MRNENKRTRDKTFMLHKQVQGKVKKLFTELKTRNRKRKCARIFSFGLSPLRHFLFRNAANF